ncbi:MULTISPECIES: hypothetical protein [unclassified Leptolyngbya]|uniref:hypothetical protein n=1 Tax=unclassified Leptolyngbya TaxID=2650499 RepID=UPI001684CCF6|nr:MULTISPECIES: hypothetical protein [unclassified Leptolyngbya]MBD1913213.1 hypothetical protein [Leptolyngbya sp. FACHB-8]MBD2154936.1 hypothetical protein [Leptolyngbya sp. FACHB-16]
MNPYSPGPQSSLSHWFTRYHEACAAIARYVASMSIDDPELQQLIVQWRSIQQERSQGE